jgi:hypothetical protein
MANDFDDERPDAKGSHDDKPTKLDEQPLLSDAQFELDDNFTMPQSQWPKIGFGVVVAIGLVMGVMYVKGLGPFQAPPPKVEEVVPVAPTPPPASLPVQQALPLPPPPPVVVPPAKQSPAAAKKAAGKKAGAKKAVKKKKKHK